MLFNHKTNKTPNFSTLTIFTTALCNLNCSYCYICKDKEGKLEQIDNELEQNFKEIYINQVLDLDQNLQNTITDISLWGGEPFLGIYRFIKYIPDFFKTFSNLKSIDVSTNMTLSDHYKRIQDLINSIEKNYYLLNINSNNEKFKIGIQISVDGYEEMNDFTRGIGITKKIITNWEKIINSLTFDINKIEIDFYTKTTLSKSSWKFVNTSENAYKWCEFFDQKLAKPWMNSNCNFSYRHGFWNNAMPTEYNKNDGIEYSKVTQSFANIYNEVNNNLKSFKEFPTVVTEALQPIFTSQQEFNNNYQQMLNSLKCKKCGMGCGVFSYNLVPIPHNKFTMCHRGLFDAYIDYINNSKRKNHLNGLAQLWTSIDAKKYWIFNKDEINQMHNMMNKLYEYNNQIFYTDLIQQIKYYAYSGLIDSKYQDLNNIIPTLSIFLLQSQCIQDDFIFGGSWTTRTPLEIPLLYNGSMDIIISEINKNIGKDVMKL